MPGVELSDDADLVVSGVDIQTATLAKEALMNQLLTKLAKVAALAVAQQLFKELLVVLKKKLK